MQGISFLSFEVRGYLEKSESVLVGLDSYSRYSRSVWEIAVHLTVGDDVYDGVFLCFSFSHKMSLMRSWT